MAEGVDLVGASRIGVTFERSVGTAVMVRYDPQEPETVASTRWLVLRTMVGVAIGLSGLALVMVPVIVTIGSLTR